MGNPTIIIILCILASALALSSTTAAAQDVNDVIIGDEVIEDVRAEQGELQIYKYDTQMYIEYNKVYVESSITFPQKQAANFSLELPYDARKIHNSIDDFEIPAIIETNNLMFYLKSVRNIKFSYVTEEMLEKDAYIASMTVPADTTGFRLKVSLPEKAILDRPMEQLSASGTAVFPKPKRLETDGQVITVVWELEDLKKDDELSFYIRYKKPARYLLPTLLIVLGLLLIAAGVAYFSLRGSSNKKGSKSSETAAEHENDISKHLKDDEQQVLNVLKLKEGSCEQGTLRIATGLSKTKLSLLLKELEERKVIHKEKRGKKNLVFLK